MSDEYNQKIDRPSLDIFLAVVIGMIVGGMVLCGGKSTRMGVPKATLPFGPELMLQRVVRLLGEVVNPIVAVAAADQTLPELPPDVAIVRDLREGRGPLEGLYAGLSAIEADAAYATSCDVPLLVPRFVQYMIDALPGHEIAVPLDDKFHHPLAAVYRTSVVPTIEKLLAADRMRPLFLFDEVKTNRIDVSSLREVDKNLHTLANLNRPEDYYCALSTAGFSAEQDVVTKLNSATE